MVTHNVGPLDRVTRTILGSLLIGGRYFFQIPGWGGDLLVMLGALWIWEGLLGYCFLYGVFNWSTKRRGKGIGNRQKARETRSFVSKY